VVHKVIHQRCLANASFSRDEKHVSLAAQCHGYNGTLIARRWRHSLSRRQGGHGMNGISRAAPPI
jgi:hypothetical protein